jgi:hypothetical protein
MRKPVLSPEARAKVRIQKAAKDQSAELAAMVAELNAKDAVENDPEIRAAAAEAGFARVCDYLDTLTP